MRHVRSIALALLTACGAHRLASPSVYVSSAMAPPPMTIAADAPGPAEAVHDWGKNPWVDARVDRLSTFAADVDTSSYTQARRALTEGGLPVPAAVRTEEFVNFFHYGFPAPAAAGPFAVVMDAAPSPLAPGRHILRVGVGTRPKRAAERKPAHLVFLVDVSGSMGAADKLGLAQHALKVLTEHLGPRDSVALVTYAGATRVVLPATGMERRADILAAIDDLTAGGSTAMASGLDLAYAEAMKGLLPGAVARVIVLSDGDANVGPAGHEAHLRIIAARAKAGVTLSTIGFGTGNYKDAAMEQLADRGDGNSFYIDSPAAATRVFSEQLGATLEVVAKDAKLQVEFDPEVVARYRLLGYENRDLADAQFRDDDVDAGEIGAGHQVTAMYEVELTPAARVAPAPLGLVRVRHKSPELGAPDTAAEATFAMSAPPAPTFAAASADLRFAFAVAAFADVLRGAEDAQRWSLDDIAAIARDAAGDDPDRAELVALIGRARALRGTPATVAR